MEGKSISHKIHKNQRDFVPLQSHTSIYRNTGVSDPLEAIYVACHFIASFYSLRVVLRVFVAGLFGHWAGVANKDEQHFQDH